MKKKFEFLEHTGDIKFKIYGKKLENLFENCALAVSSIFSRNGKIKSEVKKKISVSGKDNESKLYNFIDELIYLFDADGFVVSKAKVKILFDQIEATIYGDYSNNYNDLDSIKSPTYAEMYVKNKGNLWEAQVVVDV